MAECCIHQVCQKIDDANSASGLRQTPTLPGGQKLLIELLSPAERPIQLTSDIAQFWTGSYKKVAKDMRGRYPKHYWPEDPANAMATARTKKYMDVP